MCKQAKEGMRTRDVREKETDRDKGENLLKSAE